MSILCQLVIIFLCDINVPFLTIIGTWLYHFPYEIDLSFLPSFCPICKGLYFCLLFIIIIIDLAVGDVHRVPTVVAGGHIKRGGNN